MFYRVVARGQCRTEVDLPAGFADPGVEFVVLVTNQFFIVQTDSRKYFPAKGTERNRVHEAFRLASAKLRVADSERIAQNGRYEAGAEAVVGRGGDPRASNIVGTGLIEACHTVFGVVVRVDVVT